MLNFGVLEKGVGLVCVPDFVYDFLRKMFLILYPITDQILLSDYFYVLIFASICALQLFVKQDVMS